MINESNININFDGGLGENEIPGITDSKAIFPGSGGPMTELALDIGGEIGAIEDLLVVDGEGAIAETNIPPGLPLEKGSFVSGSDAEKAPPLTRSKSSTKEIDNLTGEVIESSLIQTRSGNSDVIKVEEVFNNGYFVAGETGELKIDYLYDGTGQQGELAIFSLKDFSKSNLESERDFIKEVTSRILSNSELGHVLVSDRTEGAYLNSWANKGEHQGVKTFDLTPGDKYGFLIVPNGTVEEVSKNPSMRGSKKPLFSLFSEEYDYLPGQQFADVTGNADILSIESSSVNNPRSDKDYEDLVINIEGLTGTVSPLDEVIKPTKDWQDKKLGKQLNEYVTFPKIAFNSGKFVVDETGELKIDYVYDGTGHEGELAIFSLDGLDDLNFKSEKDFFKEAASRALSNSEQGYVLISDKTEGAYFDGWANKGEHQGIKTFNLTPGHEYAFMIVPNGTVKEVFEKPGIGGSKKPLFSLFSEGNEKYFPGKQLADVTGNGEIFGIESSSVNNPRSDRDYEDLVINIEGLTGTVSPIDEVIKPQKDWRYKRLGKWLDEYVKFPNINFDSGYLVVDETGEVKINYLYDGTKPEGELAIFSLDGLDELNLKSQADFIEEATSRALSSSELGYVIVSDKNEGALLDSWANSGEHQGVKTFNLIPGHEYGLMLIPNGTVEEVFNNPNIGGNKKPVFSLKSEAYEEYFPGKQFADVMGDGAILTVESSQLNSRYFDGDYEDLVINIEGTTGTIFPLDEVIKPQKDWRSKSLGKKLEEYIELSNLTFDYGEFVVGETGDVSIDYLFDGGMFESELALFSLEGLEENSFEGFVKEAATRALSNSELGYIAIEDPIEGAKFSGKLGERNYNDGDYLGEKTFKMNPGDKFAFMFAPKGSIQEFFDHPYRANYKNIFFSLTTENPDDKFRMGQMGDVTGEGNIFAFEDIKVNHQKVDRDYNDFVFSVNGVEDASGVAVNLDELINEKKDWREIELGEELIEYGQQNYSTEFDLKSDRFYSPGESISVWGNVRGPNPIEKIDLQLREDGLQWRDISDVVEFEQHPLYPDLVRFDSDLTEDLDPGKYELKAIAYDAENLPIKTVSQSFTVLSLPEDYVLSDTVKASLEEAMDLSSYNPGVLARTEKWLVSVKNGASPEKLAETVGAENLGEGGHIPNTYVFKFSDNLKALEVAEKLDVTAVEFAYPLAPVRLSLLGSPNGEELEIINNDLFEDQWYLQDPQARDPKIDLNVVDVWNEYGKGEGVVIGIVDDGFQTDHPDLEDRFNKDLSFDFNDSDGDPSHQSTVVFERDDFLNFFIDDEEAKEFFQPSENFDEFKAEFEAKVIDDQEDKISFVLPTTLTGKLENVNLKLTIPENWSKEHPDLEIKLYPPEHPTGHPGTYYWSGRSYYYGWYWWPGWDGLQLGEEPKTLNLSEPDEVLEGNSIYNFQIDEFNNELAGGYWSLEIEKSLNSNHNYNREELQVILDEIEDEIENEKSWSWTLTLDTVNPHGTAVAGIAAATANNEQGVSGVAPGATLAGLRLIGDVEPLNQINGGTIADVFFETTEDGESDEETRNQKIDIFNNSWSPEYFRRQPQVVTALENSFSQGLDGKGSNIVFAAGNDRGLGGNVNFNYLANSRHTIAVGAVDRNGQDVGYSTPGSSVLVSAYSDNKDKNSGIVTTDLNGDYNYRFGGTSAAAPQVAGTIALMLQTNPELTARDVQHILVKTANRGRIADSTGWTKGADDGPRHNHKYGFGVIDAIAAVEAAESWKSVGGEFSSDEEILKFELIPPKENIPDEEDRIITVSDSKKVKELIDIEWLEVELDVDHSYSSDLKVQLVHEYTDPKTGDKKKTKSLLAKPDDNLPGNNYKSWTFTSARHWGEPSTGQWELQISDRNNSEDGQSTNDDGGTWNSWKLRLYGNTAPTATNLTNTQTYTEDVPLDFEDIVVADKNAGNTITATLTLSNPDAGKLSTGKAGDAVSSYDPETGELIISGKLEDVNELLKQVEFVPTEDYNDDLTVTTKIEDPIAEPLEGIITLEGIAVNDPPELTQSDSLGAATLGEAFTISYEDLLAALDPTDAEEDAISFQIEESFSGTLTKDGETIAQEKITLSEGEEIVWTPEVGGDEVKALTVKAFDGEDYSDAVEVAVTVAIPYVKLGDELQVNTNTEGNQAHPEVAALADGGYVVTWHSNGQDGSKYGVYGQRYDNIGNPVGDEFQINTETSDRQWFPSVTGLEDGGFVVAWHSADQDGSGFGIYGQRYDNIGNPVGDEFQVNTQTDNSQTSTAVKALADGGFVVTWESYQGSNSQYPIRIYGQRYDSSSNPVGDEFQIDTEADPDSQSLKPEVAVLEDGGFVVTWFSGIDKDDYEVYGQRYDSSSNPVGDEFQINSYADNGQYWQSMTPLTDGGFVVTWTSDGQDGSKYGIFGQRYDSGGDPVGEEFQVNTYSDREQIRSSVAALSDGGFVVTWQSEVQDGEGWGVFGRRFDRNGNLTGEEFQVNTHTDSDQRLPSVATLADGQFVVAWASHSQDGSSNGIYAQRFGINTVPTLTKVSTLTGAARGEAFTISYDDLLDASNVTDAEGDTISFQIEGLLSGELTKDGETVAPGETVLAEGEEIVWTPVEVGSAVKALSVKAFDGKEYSDTAVEVQVTVDENLPDPPWENVVFGIKSTSFGDAGSGFVSKAPARLFWFDEDSTRVADRGAITLDGEEIDADGLAISQKYGLLAFEIAPTDSTLISIDPNTAVATTIGDRLTGKDIRGAAFDRNDNLWVVDAANNELLQLNPEDGSVLQSLTMTLEGESFEIHKSLTDLAIAPDGTFYLTNYFIEPDSSSINPNGTAIFTLDPKTGVLTYKSFDKSQALPGLTFSQIAAKNELFGYEINSDEDILIYDTDADYQRKTHFSDILPTFNSGRGDLAALPSPAPKGEEATENILYLNSTRGEGSTGNRGDYRSVIADFIDDYQGGNVFDVDFVQTHDSGDLASFLNAKPINYYDQIWFDTTIRDTSLLNAGDLEALNAWSANQQPEFILDTSFFARNGAQTAMNTSAGALTVNQALALQDAGGGILIGTDHNSYAYTANQVLTNFGFDELLTGSHNASPNSSFVGDLLLAPNSVGGDFFSMLEGFTISNVPVGTHVLNENGGNRTIEIYENLFSSNPDKVSYIGTSFDTPIDIPGIENILYLNSTRGENTGNWGDYRSVIADFIDDYEDGNVFDVDFLQTHDSGDLASILNAKPVGYYDQIWFDSTIKNTSLLNAADLDALNAWSANEQPEFIFDSSYFTRHKNTGTMNASAGALTVNQALALKDAGGGIFIGTDQNIYANTANQVLTNFGFDELFTRSYMIAENSSFVGDSLLTPNSVDAEDFYSQHLEGHSTSNVPVGTHVLNENGGNRTIEVYHNFFSSSPYQVAYIGTSFPVGEAISTEPFVKLGDELQVNTYTNSEQNYPAVTALSDGGFVVTWHSNGQDGSEKGIFGQRHDSRGNPVGEEFQVNTYTNNFQAYPSVAALPDGGFVVTWHSNLQDGSDYGIFGQRYNSSGNRVGNEFRVNTKTIGYQAFPSVNALADGGFVVTWTSRDNSIYSFFGQRYDSNGNSVGEEFQVDPAANGYGWWGPKVATLSDGEFVVTWSSENADGSNYDVYGQRYNSSGDPIGEKFQVNTYTSDRQNWSSVTALANSGFIVTWQSNGQDGSSDGVFGQRYDSSGKPVGEEFQVNTYTNSWQMEPSATALPDGGFIVTWQSNGQDGSSYGVFGQRYDSNGKQVGEEFQINTYIDSSQRTPSVAALPEGFVVTWASLGQDGSDYGIYAQRFGINTAPTLTEVSTLTGTTEGEAYTISYEELLAASNATDADGDALTFQIEESLSGTLTKNGETVAPGETILAKGEEIVWTPGEVGDAVEALSVKAFDGKEYSDTAVEVVVAVEEAILTETNLEWARSIGGSSHDIGRGIAADSNNNVLVTGWFVNTIDIDGDDNNDLIGNGNNSDSYVAKLDSNGNLLWAKNIGGSGSDLGFGIAADSSGNVLVTGTFQNTIDIDSDGNNDLSSNGTSDSYVAKFDSSGNLVWAKNIGGNMSDYGSGIATDSNSNVLVTGRFQDSIDIDSDDNNDLSSNGSQDSYVAKFDSSGNLVWAENIGGSSNDLGLGIATDSIGNVLITGSFSNTIDIDSDGNNDLSSNGSQDSYVVKFDSSGNLVWAENIGGSSNDWGQGITTDSSSNILVTGYFENTVDIDSDGNNDLTSSGGEDSYVAKLDSSGNLVWAKNIGGSGSDKGLGIATDSSGNVLVTGGFQNTIDINSDGSNDLTSSGGEDSYIAKLDSDGNFVWADNIGHSGNDSGLDIAADRNGNILATGYYFQDDIDIDSDGNNDLIINDLSDSYVVKFSFNESGNTPPTLTNIATLSGATETQPYTITYNNLLAASNATDADGDALTFQIEESSSGTLTKNGETVAPGATVLAEGEELVWTPDFVGDAVKALSVKAFDGKESSDTAVEVAIAVEADNTAPTLTNISTLTGAFLEQPFTITYEDLLAAADVTDAEGDPISFRIKNILGSLTEDGQTAIPSETILSEGEELVWMPYALSSEVMAFTVTAFDGKDDSSNTIVVTVSVTEPIDDRFTDIGAELEGVQFSSGLWGDYDNDGDLDVLLTGTAEDSSAISKVYRNDGGNFTDIGAALKGTASLSNAAAWGDYDNDNDLDILLTSTHASSYGGSAIYRNDGGNFVEIPTNLPKVGYSSVDWGDYDNDGDLDIVLTGDSGPNISKVYRNDSGVFIDIEAGLVGVSYGSAVWGDYDNDGDLDIFLGRSSQVSKIYRNDSGSFIDINANLVAGSGFGAWGDYDNDGDLDLLMSSKLYQNDGGVFTALEVQLTGTRTDWGDYDNDGDLDILFSDGNVYRNDGGSFTRIGVNLGIMSSGNGGSASWGDYDNDGDLDALLTGFGPDSAVAKIYRNNIVTAADANKAPNAPTGLAALADGSDVTFSWNTATDAETPTKGLTYNLRVGTTPGGSDIVSPMSLNEGDRLIPAMGNTNQNTRWTIKDLEPGTYYWSVQAVDAGFAGSEFASEGTFTVVRD